MGRPRAGGRPRAAAVLAVPAAPAGARDAAGDEAGGDSVVDAVRAVELSGRAGRDRGGQRRVFGPDGERVDTGIVEAGRRGHLRAPIERRHRGHLHGGLAVTARTATRFGLVRLTTARYRRST